MKKILAIILALLMLLSLASLAACGETKKEEKEEAPVEQEKETEKEPETTEPEGEKTLEELAAETDWDSLLLGFTCVDLSDAFVQAIVGGAAERFEELGCSTSIAEYKGDPNQDIVCIENFITMGVDLVFDFCLAPEPMQDIAQKCLDAGIMYVVGGAAPDYAFTAAMNTDHVTIGRLTSEMAIDWVDKNFPNAGEDEIHAAAAVSTAIQALKDRSDAMVETLDADPRIKVVYTAEGQMIDEGFNIAEEALTYDSGVRIFVCANDSLALGVNNYIMTLADADLNEFAVFGSGYTDETTAVANASADNSSVLRGLIGYGTLNPSDGCFNCIYNCLIGNPLYKDSYVQWDEMFYIGPNDFVL